MRLLNTLGVVGLIACSGDKSEPAANSAPIFTSIEITPSEGITTSTELLCVATATDDDNDALQLNYQWTDADGTVLSETDSLTLSPENTAPTAEITCTATVSDGEVSVTRYTRSESEKWIRWTPVKEGNGSFNGCWELRKEGNKTHVHFENEGYLELPLPRLTKRLVKPFVEKQFQTLLDEYIANLQRTFDSFET